MAAHIVLVYFKFLILNWIVCSHLCYAGFHSSQVHGWKTVFTFAWLIFIPVFLLLMRQKFPLQQHCLARCSFYRHQKLLLDPRTCRLQAHCPNHQAIGAVVDISSLLVGFESRQKLPFSHSLRKQGLIIVHHVFWSACKIPSWFSLDWQFAIGLPH